MSDRLAGRLMRRAMGAGVVAALLVVSGVSRHGRELLECAG